MATYWENSCSFGLRNVLWYKYLTVGLVFSHLGFWSGNLSLIAPFPDLCLLVPFYQNDGNVLFCKYFYNDECFSCIIIILVVIAFIKFVFLFVAAPVAERLRALFLNHSIISPLCLVWVRAPLWPHVRQAKFCLRVFFSGFSRFRPPTYWPVSYELK